MNSNKAVILLFVALFIFAFLMMVTAELEQPSSPATEKEFLEWCEKQPHIEAQEGPEEPVEIAENTEAPLPIEEANDGQENTQEEPENIYDGVPVPFLDTARPDRPDDFPAAYFSVIIVFEERTSPEKIREDLSKAFGLIGTSPQVESIKLLDLHGADFVVEGVSNSRMAIDGKPIEIYYIGAED